MKKKFGGEMKKKLGARMKKKLGAKIAPTGANIYSYKKATRVTSTNFVQQKLKSTSNVLGWKGRKKKRVFKTIRITLIDSKHSNGSL
jgi:hypothetical protein